MSNGSELHPNRLIPEEKISKAPKWTLQRTAGARVREKGYVSIGCVPKLIKRKEKHYSDYHLNDQY